MKYWTSKRRCKRW